MYKCKIIADSINPQNDRLITFVLTYPRIVHSEIMTHRMFSRNSASSRAIPFKKMVKMVEENPFIPIAWQRDHKGMQGTEYIEDKAQVDNRIAMWLQGRDFAVKSAKNMSGLEVTKQLCNRLLEPFMWHTVIVTATEWENFFNLRCPQYQTPVTQLIEPARSKKDCIKNHGNPENIEKLENFTDLEWYSINKSQAEIHIQAIAELMWDAYNESKPKQLQAGEWHIPFGDNFEEELLGKLLPEVRLDSLNWYTDAINDLKVKIATARCARISYQTLGDNPKIDYEADIKLHDMLAASGHWSPFEHVARAMSDKEYYSYANGKINESIVDVDGFVESSTHINTNIFGWCRNFKGFIQYRHLVDGNNT